MGRMARIVGEFREQLRRARAEMKGEGRSRAVLIKQAMDIPEIRDRIATAETVKVGDKDVTVYRMNRVGPPRPIRGALVRDVDGAPKIFFDDGSLRHATGHKPGKAARKAIKRARMHLRREGKNV